MRKIEFYKKTHGYLKLLIDDQDYHIIDGKALLINKSDKGNLYVKIRYVDPEHPRKKFFLHRLILGISDRSIYIDHKDGNPLNNQRSNLRICTASQNSMNRTHTVVNLNSLKGVSKNGPNRYSATVRVKGVTHYGGLFKNKYAAAIKYNELAIRYHGEFANLNPVTATKYKDGTMYVHEKKTGAITERIHQFVSI